MGDPNFKDLALELHRKIQPILSDSDLNKVAEYLKEIYEKGRKIGALIKPKPYTITNTSDDKIKSWTID